MDANISVTIGGLNHPEELIQQILPVLWGHNSNHAARPHFTSHPCMLPQQLAMRELSEHKQQIYSPSCNVVGTLMFSEPGYELYALML